jgi:hypothetical protein
VVKFDIACARGDHLTTKIVKDRAAKIALKLAIQGKIIPTQIRIGHNRTF